MADYRFAPGSQDKTVYVFIRSGATGGTLAALSYMRSQAAGVSFLGSQLAAADTAHTDGGWKEVAGGATGVLYRVDLPDAALLVGVPSVEVYARDNGAASGHVTVAIEPITTPYLVEKSHVWFFNTQNQITASNNINETAGLFDGLVEMEFSGRMPALDSIDSITSVTVADVVGETEPTITTYSISADKKKVDIHVNALSATDATYTFTVKIVTADGQTITGKGRLVLT